MSPNPELLHDLDEEFLNMQNLHWGLQGDFLLISWLCSGILCSSWIYHLPPGWKTLVPAEELKDTVVYIPSERTRTLPYHCSNFFFFFFFFWPCHSAYGILVPQPGIEPRSWAVKAQTLNHWTTREFPAVLFSDWSSLVPAFPYSPD